MTKQEFTERVKVNVSDEEFAAINVVYNVSDLDKDAFCKAWKSMNRSRVEQAQEELKARKAFTRKLERILAITRKLQHSSIRIASDALSYKDIDFISELGISVYIDRYGSRVTTWGLAYDLDKYLQNLVAA